MINISKYIWISFVSVLVLIAIILAVIFFLNFIYNPSGRSLKNSEKFSTDLKVALTNTLGKEYPIAIKNQVDVLNNPKKTDKEKYEALQRLSYYFSAEYSRTHNPKIKEYNDTVLNEFAKENYNDFYNQSHFRILCSDTICGQKLSTELVEVINITKSSRIRDYAKVTIEKNLTTAGYAPDKDIDNKRFGFSIVYGQLSKYGDSEASRAAALLKDFAKNKYQIDL